MTHSMTHSEIARIVQYCADEVGRQLADPPAVGWMVKAWLHAMAEQGDGVPLTPGLVARIGQMVEPTENALGFRTVNVRVGSSVRPPYSQVPDLVAQWCDNVKALTPSEAYRIFEEIHPFRDGNGRTGKVLFNWLGGWLDMPRMPPNFWNCANP